MKRLLKKGKYKREEILNILESQISQEEKLKFADYIIDNSDSVKEFERNIKKVIKKLK